MPLLYFCARSADISSSGNPIEWTDMKQQQTTRPGPTERSSTALSARGPAPVRRSTGRTQDIDRHVGARVRERRIMLGLTQQQLADLIGVTYQQAHKYERGINRVSAGRLFEIARVLNASITYFYEGLGEEQPRPATPHQRMLLEIARNFSEIQNEKHQEAV